MELEETISMSTARQLIAQTMLSRRGNTPRGRAEFLNAMKDLRAGKIVYLGDDSAVQYHPLAGTFRHWGGISSADTGCMERVTCKCKKLGCAG